jgi:putative addiction module component (TIGR02574 family)
MMQKEFSKIFEMSVAQRLLLVEDIWDSIAENPDAVPLTDSQKKDLDKRLNAYYENPEAGKSWAEVKEKILSPK